MPCRCGSQRRSECVTLLIGASLLAIILWPDFSEVQAGSIPASSLTGFGVPAVDAAYKKRYRSTYRDVPTVTRSASYRGCGRRLFGRKACGAFLIANTSSSAPAEADAQKKKARVGASGAFWDLPASPVSIGPQAEKSRPT